MYTQEQLSQIENVLDRLSTENWDLTEQNLRLEMREAQLASQLEGAHQLQQRLQAASNEELKRACDQINAAKKEQERIQRNCDHATRTVQDLNRNFDLMKKEMDKLRNQHIAEEHFARKLVELCDANTKLRSEIATLKEQEKNALEILAQRETPSEEIRKYQEQVTRLLNERLTLDCSLSFVGGEQGTFCGGCLACQLKQAQTILEQASKHLKDRNEELAQTKAIVVQTAANVKDRNDKIFALENQLLSVNKDVSDWQSANAETTKLLHNEQEQSLHRRDVIFAAVGGLKTILSATVFTRKAKTQEVLDTILTGIKTRNLPDAWMLAEQTKE